MNLLDAQQMALELMNKHGIHGWHFEFDRSVSRFGVCKFRSLTIGLSRRLTSLNGVEHVRDTILHEIAHALVGAHHGHDHAWKAKAAEIGAKPERCYRSDEVKNVYRWVGSCSDCGHQFGRHRMSRVRRMYGSYHISCKQKEKKGEIVWKKNQ